MAQRDAYANLLLPSLLKKRGLAGRDAALATELAYGTLRGQGSYDAIIAVCSDRALEQIDPPILQVIRLGVHQLLATRIRAPAAVATSVDLARDVAGQRPAGFVNAILRKVATRDLAAWIEIAAPERAADPAGYLSVRYSHPRWIVSALREALGRDSRRRSGRDQRDACRRWRPATGDPVRNPWSRQPCRTRHRRQVSQPAGRRSGYISRRGTRRTSRRSTAGARRSRMRQASSAVLALTRADARGPDSRWLDLSAGPGGKARLLAGLAAGPHSRLVAADVRPHRAGLVRAATASTGRAGVVVADGTVPAWRQGTFDRVLADVPCSGLGALRRRPEARWRRTPADIGELGGLQRGLLAAALDSARPGGVVGYVTCSPHLAETRQVVAAVLAARDDVQVLDAPALLPEVPDLRCPAPDGLYAQFWPHRHGTDGIFLALLRRSAPRS